jgi:hypothetical protein
MYSRAVLKSLPQTNSGVAGPGIGHRISGIRHPDAVERVLGHIHRGGEIPLVACCAEDLEIVRRHVTFARTGVDATDARTVPEAHQEQHPEPRRTSPRQRQSAPASTEREHRLGFLRVVLMVVLTIAIIWQLGLWGVTATLTSHAADEAARAASADGSTAEVRDDALRSVPSWLRDNLDVSQTTLGTVKVTSSMPVLAPILTVDGLDLTSEAPIVAENS